MIAFIGSFCRWFWSYNTVSFFFSFFVFLLITLFSLKFPVLQENLDVYMGLQQFIVTTGTST